MIGEVRPTERKFVDLVLDKVGADGTFSGYARYRRRRHTDRLR
ncbi:hypothetical protein [Ollibium composti]|nr:hypothetical protein [Mesorhizobium composti]